MADDRNPVELLREIRDSLKGLPDDVAKILARPRPEPVKPKESEAPPKIKSWCEQNPEQCEKARKPAATEEAAKAGAASEAAKVRAPAIPSVSALAAAKSAQPATAARVPRPDEQPYLSPADDSSPQIWRWRGDQQVDGPVIPKKSMAMTAGPTYQQKIQQGANDTRHNEQWREAEKIYKGIHGSSHPIVSGFDPDVIPQATDGKTWAGGKAPLGHDSPTGPAIPQSAARSQIGGDQANMPLSGGRDGGQSTVVDLLRQLVTLMGQMTKGATGGTGNGRGMPEKQAFSPFQGSGSHDEGFSNAAPSINSSNLAGAGGASTVTPGFGSTATMLANKRRGATQFSRASTKSSQTGAAQTAGSAPAMNSLTR